MLRIIFSSEDLRRIRLAPGPDHLWEIANGVQTLQRRDGTSAFGSWRQFVLIIAVSGFAIVHDTITVDVASATSPGIRRYAVGPRR